MSDAPEVIKKLQDGLAPCIKPREQVNYIRRVLALNLGYSSNDGPLKLPLALVEGASSQESESQVKGIQKEYIEALKANATARRQFEDVSQSNDLEATAPAEEVSSRRDILQGKVEALKLGKTLARLLLVQQYLDRLVEEQPHTHGSLDTNEIFQDAQARPSVPKAVLENFGALKHGTDPSLKTRVKQLEKTLLKAKLFLRQEEQALQRLREATRQRTDHVARADRLVALSETRDVLIGWIESELGKTSEEDAPDGEAGDTGAGTDVQGDQRTMSAHLADIKSKYAEYVALRKALLSTLARQIEPSERLVLPRADTVAAQPPSDPEAADSLLTPYLESLLAVSKNQKNVIAEKAYIKSTLNDQSKEARQTLGHLAEESQLLPAYPLKDSLRRRSGLWNELTTKASERPDLANRIQPWIFAADSAKIATLEAVAETVDAGQGAYETSIKSIEDMQKLLGQRPSESTSETAADRTEDDLWLGEGAEKSQITRKRTNSKAQGHTEKQDMWSGLHGSLGLIGHADSI